MMKKIFKILGVIIFVLLVVTGGMFSWFISQNNKPAGSNPVQYGQDGPDMKRALVVFQPSRSGITDRAANEIAEGLVSEGFYVLADHPGEHLPENVDAYDIVVFGTPVYVGRPSGVLLEYMDRVLFGDHQRVYLFSTGSTQDTSEWESMERSLSGKVTVKDRRKFNTDQEGILLNEALQYGKDMGEISE
jgi:hypothetical protein